MRALTARLAPAESPPIADPPAIAVPSARVVGRPSDRENRVFQCCRERVLGGQPIVEDDCQITRFGKLHPQLPKRGWAAERPSTAVQVDHHRMSTGTLWHRYVGAKARAQLHVLFETANCRKILVVNDRQLLPGAALRSNVAGGIPDRQSTQNLTIMFADHTSHRPDFRRALAQRAALGNQLAAA